MEEVIVEVEEEAEVVEEVKVFTSLLVPVPINSPSPFLFVCRRLWW